ncbi:MAG: class I SAM-dependent methyltransferase [Aristaeellaceae bacterium]
MPVIQGLGGTFDSVADAYAHLRPGYPEGLYQAIFRCCPLGPESHAVEVGVGGGQATLPILRTGCRVTAIEPGERFSTLCREKFRDWPGFTVHTARFEEAAFLPDSIDLVYAASSFHWVPEDIGYGKVYAMLKPGGVFARFANHPGREGNAPALTEEIDRLYRQYYDPFYPRTGAPDAPYGPAQASARARLATRYGFTDVRWALFHRTRSYTAEGYVALLGTYSDHIALAEPTRHALLTGIGEAIDRHGGVMTLQDTIDLQLARKP